VTERVQAAGERNRIIECAQTDWTNRINFSGSLHQQRKYFLCEKYHMLLLPAAAAVRAVLMLSYAQSFVAEREELCLRTAVIKET
jgi:hypothetical protein